jgi:hypothetical protein
LRASLGPVSEVRIQREKVHRLVAKVEQLECVTPIEGVSSEVVALVLRHFGERTTILVSRIQPTHQLLAVVSVSWKAVRFKNPSGPCDRIRLIDRPGPDTVKKIGVLSLWSVFVLVEVIEVKELDPSLSMTNFDPAFQYFLTWSIQDGLEGGFSFFLFSEA